MGRHGSMCVRRGQALILRKHIGAVMDVCWSPFEETTLVSASSSSVIYSWDTRTPKASQVITCLICRTPRNRTKSSLIARSSRRWWFRVCLVSWFFLAFSLPPTLSAVNLARDTCVIRQLLGCFCWSWRTCAVHELHVKITCLSTF